MLKEIKSLILQDKENNNCYKESISSLTDHGYKVEYINKEVLGIGGFKTGTIYYYEVTKKSTGEFIYISVIISNRSNKRITQVYEVNPSYVDFR